MTVRWSRVICRVVALVLVPGAMAGCAGARVGPPTDRELVAVRNGAAAVVMLRAVVETGEGGERAAFGPGWPGGGKSVSLVRLDAARRPTAATPLRWPSRGAMRGAWAYLLLKPGTYYLLIHDNDPAGLAPEAARAGEDWLLEVPAGVPLVYAGTVVFAHEADGAAGASHPGNHLEHHHHRRVDTRVRDDSKEAQRLASRWFAGLTLERAAAPRTIIVRRYAAAGDDAGMDGLSAPPSVRVEGRPPAKGYNVRAAFSQDGARPGLLHGQPILSGPGSSTNSAADLGLGAIKAGLYLWAGAGAVANSAASAGAARDIQPCVAQTVKWAGEYDLARRLSESLARLPGPVAGGPAGARPIEPGATQSGHTGPATLSVSVQRLRVRPGAKAYLAIVEAKVRVRLWDPRRQRHLADRYLVYSHPSARHRGRPYGRPFPPYELPVDQAAVLDLRSLARLPQEERRARVEAEMGRAVAALSEQITRDFPPRPTGDGGADAPRQPRNDPRPAAATPSMPARPTTRPTTRPTPRPTTRAILRPSTGATTRPATQPSTRPATRPLGGADGAAAEFIRGLERREEALLARVIAPGDDETPADRARSTLAGAGSFRGIAGILRDGTKVWIGNVEAGVPVDGRGAARVQLLRTGKRGDERSAGSLELTRFDDGWRVRDWDMPH